MRPQRIFIPATILLAGLAVSLFAADNDKKETASKEAPRPSYEMPQPEKESLALPGGVPGRRDVDRLGDEGGRGQLPARGGAAGQ